VCTFYSWVRAELLGEQENLNRGLSEQFLIKNPSGLNLRNVERTDYR
jgi:hypothetical protein